MKKLLANKKLVIGIVILAIALAAYFLFFKKKADPKVIQDNFSSDPAAKELMDFIVSMAGQDALRGFMGKAAERYKAGSMADAYKIPGLGSTKVGAVMSAYASDYYSDSASFLGGKTPQQANDEIYKKWYSIYNRIAQY